jgi:hypothetical protein
MEQVAREPNRFFLGRLPLEEEGVTATTRTGVFTPRAEVGGRRAARLRIGGPGGGLARWLRKDPHLGSFLKVPAKENGLDILSDGLPPARRPRAAGKACGLESRAVDAARAHR